jgi:hypothetical protein
MNFHGEELFLLKRRVPILKAMRLPIQPICRRHQQYGCDRLRSPLRCDLRSPQA